MRLLLFFMCFTTTLTAQTYQVYAIQTNGQRGELLRTERYAQNKKIHSKHYTADGQLHYEVNFKYNDLELPTERIQTFKKDHEFDLIRQYTYNVAGQKTGELFGNNRTGKWGSYRFNYHPQGDVDTVFVYQKNGDLTNLRVYELEYDNRNRKTLEREKRVDLELEEEERGATFSYEYSADGRTTTVVEKNAAGQIMMTESTTVDAQNRPLVQTIKMPDQAPLTMKYRYNKKGQVVEIQEFTNGKLTLTTTQIYADNGIMVEKKYRFADGTYGGERYVQ